jgi:hypothetical protein
MQRYSQVSLLMRLAELRTRYEELSSVYEALRRMVERGYVTYTT